MRLWSLLLVATLATASCAGIDKALGGDPGHAPMTDQVPVEQGGGSTLMFRMVADGGRD